MKTYTIKADHVFVSGRGEEESVAEALAWVAKYVNVEDEDGETSEVMTPADLLVYGVRRLRALHKDGKRYDSGKLASRLYSPRLDNVESAPKALHEAVETIGEVSEKLAKQAEKPAKKAPAKKAPAKKEPTAPAKKEPAKKEPTAPAKKEPTAPTVRKAPQVHVKGATVVNPGGNKAIAL